MSQTAIATVLDSEPDTLLRLPSVTFTGQDAPHYAVFDIGQEKEIIVKTTPFLANILEHVPFGVLLTIEVSALPDSLEGTGLETTIFLRYLHLPAYPSRAGLLVEEVT